MSKKSRRVVSMLAFMTLGLIGIAAPKEARADDCHGSGGDDDVDVDQVFFPVHLSDGHDYRIAGYLFHHGSSNSDILQVTVHGATQYHLYWDFPKVNGVDYSYARYMARRGYTVLAIDQLGTGASSQPDGDFVNLEQTASALHQVLANLRENHNPTGHAHSRIALVGHSNGSLTSIYATGTYHDADALVATSFIHSPHPLPFNPGDILSLLTTPYIPATAFSKAFWTATFYYAPTTDPALVDYEYAHLGPAVQARAQFLDLFNYSLNSSLTRSTAIDVPVLVQAGNFDALDPNAYMGPEASYYPNSPSVTLNFLTDIGHNINGHINHLQSWTRIDDWITAKLGHDHGHGHDGH